MIYKTLDNLNNVSQYIFLVCCLVNINGKSYTMFDLNFEKYKINWNDDDLSN